MAVNNLPLIETPVRVAYITSAREIADEGVGSSIPYSQDSLAVLQKNSQNGGKYQISMIIIDDENSQISPEIRSRLEATNLPIVQIPSSWAKISGNPQAKAQAKEIYEHKILQTLRQNKIDVLLSDSYTRIFTSTIIGEGKGVIDLNGSPRQAYDGLVLNVHPADTSINPGISPTSDAIFRRNLFRRICSKENFTQINGERYYKIPLNNQRATFRENEIQAAQRIFVNNYQNTSIIEQNNQYYLLTPVNGKRGRFCAKTGATFHNIDLGIDTGRKIRVSNSTPIRNQDSEQSLRERNYDTKNRVLLTGLMMRLNDSKMQKRINQNRQLNSSIPKNGMAVSAPKFHLIR